MLSRCSSASYNYAAAAIVQPLSLEHAQVQTIGVVHQAHTETFNISTHTNEAGLAKDQREGGCVHAEASKFRAELGQQIADVSAGLSRLEPEGTEDPSRCSASQLGETMPQPLSSVCPYEGSLFRGLLGPKQTEPWCIETLAEPGRDVEELEPASTGLRNRSTSWTLLEEEGGRQGGREAGRQGGATKVGEGRAGQGRAGQRGGEGSGGRPT